MTHEQMNAFQDWWNKSSIACERGTDCRDAFASGWEAAQVTHTAGRLNSYAQGKTEARNAIETRLLGMAGHAFVAGKDEHAHWFRSLVNVLFKSEDK